MRRRIFNLATLLLIVAPVVCNAEEPPKVEITIATYNINWGNPNLRAATRAISESQADIVCLQETTRVSERYLVARFRKEYPHIRFVGDQGRFAAERFGFLSKLPLEDLKYFPPEHGLFGFFRADVKAGETRVQIANVHLDPFRVRRGGGVTDVFGALTELEETHAEEIEHILDNLDEDKPTLITGDFNSLSTSSAPHHLAENKYIDSFAQATENPEQHPTWNWRFPRLTLKLRIDYIFHTDDFETLDSSVIKSNGSDHFLLKSRLRVE